MTMLSRVTSQTQVQSGLRNLQSSASRMGELQMKAADLKKINNPSDDPSAAIDAMKVHGEQRSNTQFGRNIDDGNGWMATINSSLDTATSLLNRAKDLTLQGANGSMSAEARESIAIELDGLQQDLLGIANSEYLGRNVFAGNSDSGSAFNKDFTFTGVPGSVVERRVGDNETIRVDADGTAIFGEGDGSVFKLLADVAADLRSGADVSTRLTEIDGFVKSTIAGRAETGARHSRLLRAEDTNLETKTSLENRRIAVEDVELTDVIMELKLQEVNYQAALAITSKVLQNSLMDFLR